VRSWPALDLRFLARRQPAAGELKDRVIAVLDDFSPTAIEDAAPDAWRVFFHAADDRAGAAAAVASGFPALVTATAVEVDDEDWAARSQADLKAVAVGRIVVAPPWDVPEPSATAPSQAPGPKLQAPIVIVIQPSMGFGTGHHPSTRLCLTALQRLDVRGAQVVDVGTGSGVLALAAVALGAGRVIGLDEDPDAIAAARENAGLNGDPAELELHAGAVAAAADFGLVFGEADLVVANLTSVILRREGRVLERLLGPGGLMILSGFTVDEEASVREAFPAATVKARDVDGDWVALTLTCG
jgi:ribosomal protein L11 methyltransferase